MNIVHKIESFLPQSWVDTWRLFKRYRIKHSQYAKKIKELRKVNRPIRVCFFALDASTWKCDSIYQQMEQDSSFDPVVVVCPIENQGKENMLHKMNECYSFFIKKQYNVLKAYDELADKYIDAHDLHPDIIFYLNPYRYLIDDRYYIDKFEDVLMCYIDYSLEIMNEKWAYSQPLQQLVWKYFVPSNLHKKIIESYECCFVNNVFVSGYPTSDLFQKEQSTLRVQQKKTIIWAPHQSIFAPKNNDEISVRWSTFLLYADYMLSIIRKYNDVRFIFRPHPLLKMNLYKHPEWGKERTDRYYDELLSLPNVELSVGDYIKQFCESDALIHDGGGFMAEYLYTQKPCLYLSNYINEYINKNRVNRLGIVAWQAHYHAYTQDEVGNFINNVVLEDNDVMKEKRCKVLEKYMQSPKGETVAETIIRMIKEEIL